MQRGPDLNVNGSSERRQVGRGKVHVRGDQGQAPNAPSDIEVVHLQQFLVGQAQTPCIIQHAVVEVRGALPRNVGVPVQPVVHAMQAKVFDGSVRRGDVNRGQQVASRGGCVGPYVNTDHAEASPKLPEVQATVVHHDGGFTDRHLMHGDVLEPEVHGVVDADAAACVAADAAVSATHVAVVGLDVVGRDVMQTSALPVQHATESVFDGAEVRELNPTTVFDE